MKEWITSDLHFGHGNIIKFCPNTRKRFLESQGDPDKLLAILNNPDEAGIRKRAILDQAVQYMNAQMISDWNNKVQPDDVVTILGDVSFMQLQDTVKILKKLNGRKVLIAGNHDNKLVLKQEFVDCFEAVHDYLERDFNGTRVSMFHYPICEFNGSHHGHVHLHGHLHGNASGLEKFRVRDVGYDATGNIVSDLLEVIADAMTGEPMRHHDKLA